MTSTAHPSSLTLGRRTLLGLGLGVAAGGLGFGLTGCSATAVGTGGTTGASPSGAQATAAAGQKLVVWADGARVAAVTAVGVQFSRDHPGTVVEVVPTELGDIAKTLAKAVADGKGPDLATVAHSRLGVLRAADAIAPIELGTAAGLLLPQAVAAFSTSSQVYGVPYGTASLALVRNNKLSTATPKTFDELVAAGSAVAKKTPLVVGIGADGNAHQLFGWQSSFGNTGFTQESTGTLGGDVTLGDQTGLAFAGWLAGQGSKGTKVLDTGVTVDQAKQRFLDGDAVFWVTGPGDAADIAAAKLDVAVLPLPAAGGQDARPLVSVEGFVLSAQSKNALLATDFAANYLTGIDVQVAAAVGQLPAVRSARQDDSIAKNAVLAGFAAADASSLPAPSSAAMDKVWPLWGTAEAQVIGGADPNATWATLADQVSAATG